MRSRGASPVSDFKNSCCSGVQRNRATHRVQGNVHNFICYLVVLNGRPQVLLLVLVRRWIGYVPRDIATARFALGLGLGKICNEVHLQFSLCTFAVFCLGRVTFSQPASRTTYVHTVKDFRCYKTYLIFTAELTRGLVCSDSIYTTMIFLLVGTYCN